MRRVRLTRIGSPFSRAPRPRAAVHTVSRAGASTVAARGPSRSQTATEAAW